MNLQLFQAINGLAGHSRWLDNFMVFCATDLIYVIGLIFVVCLAALVYKKQWRSAIWLIVTLIISFIILKIAGSFVIESRPFVDHQVIQLIPHDIDNSFPSDHATASLAMALGLFYFTRWRAAALAVLVLAVLVGFARVFVGVHYPGDVVGAWVIAVIGSLVTFFVAKLWPERASNEPTV